MSDGWHDFATAPRDGRQFLIWREGMSVATATYWRKGQEIMLMIHSPGDWPERPTHWAPIPTFPTPPTHNGEQGS